MSNEVWGSSVRISQSATRLYIKTYRLTASCEKDWGLRFSLPLNAARAVRYSLAIAIDTGKDAEIEIQP